ncbi:hypothetical protein GYMLUDRAFT_239297 [Collybiopsis luxurians FD-317 M1]|nr:hypothetical protein GYMLUDRAFT_239297 [Collybiopsis luxurians FD-317 M1]
MSSAATYTSHFGELVVHTQWNDAMKIENFYKGLKDATKDYISHTKCKDHPTDFDSYVMFAIDCDNSAHECELKWKSKLNGKSANGSNGNSSKNSTSNTSYVPVIPSIPASSATPLSMGASVSSPSPVVTVDNRPIASGLITLEVIANISISSHCETLTLAVISVSYPIILGLDWLCHHNPLIDWHSSFLELNCCNLNRVDPIKVYGKDLGLSMQPLLNNASVGLGFGLSTSPLQPFYPSTFATNKSLVSDPEFVTDVPPTPAPPQPKTSFLATFVHHNGYGNSMKSSLSTPPPPDDPSTPLVDKPPDVKILNPCQFYQFAKSSQVSYLHFFDHHSSIYICSFAPDPLTSDEPNTESPLEQPDDVEDLSSFIPDHYQPWADTVFNPQEFEKLSEHCPFDIKIELDEGNRLPLVRCIASHNKNAMRLLNMFTQTYAAAIFTH